MAAIDRIRELAQKTYYSINGAQNDDTGTDLVDFENNFIMGFNLWKDEYETEAYWNRLRTNDYVLATIANTTTYSFDLPEEYRTPVFSPDKYLKFVSDGIVIARFKLVDPNQRVVDDDVFHADRATFVDESKIILSRAPTAEEVGATIVLDVVQYIPALTRTDDTALGLIYNQNIAVLGVAKNNTLADVTKVSLSPSFAQKYANELAKALMANNASNELDDMRGDDFSGIGGYLVMAVDKPVKVKGAAIATPIQILSFDAGLDERGDYNIPPNAISYGRNGRINSANNFTKRFSKKRWLPDSVGFNGEVSTVYYNGEIIHFIADDSEVVYCRPTDTAWTACGGTNSITTTAGVITTFLRVNDILLCMNGVDELRYIDLATLDMVVFTFVADPVPAITAVATGITGTGPFNVYYAYTYNSDGGGETAISPILTQAVSKSRTTWAEDGTEYLTLTFNDTPPVDATSRNLYAAIALQGTTPVASDLAMLRSNIPVADADFVDNGSIGFDISFNPAPDINSTAGIKATSGDMAGSIPVLYGDPDNPYDLYFGALTDTGVSFGANNGAQRLPLLKGTNYYPTSVIGFRNNQNIPNLLALFSGTEGVSKQQIISLKTLSYGNTTVNYWGADDLNAGASAVYSRYGVVSYLGQLIFPSSNGVTSLKTEQSLQNVLAASIISDQVSDTYSTIKNADFDKIVGAAWNNLVALTIPSRGFDYNNQVLVYDLTNKDKPKWYIWDLEVDWIGSISPPNADSFFYIRQDNHFFKLVDSFVAEDENADGTSSAYPVEVHTALVPANQVRNSFFASVQAVVYVANFIGTVWVEVTYINAKGRVKTKRKSFTNGTYSRNFLSGWGNPRLLYQSFNNRVINWSTPMPSSGESNDTSKIVRRLKIRLPNPVVNEAKFKVWSELDSTSFDVVNCAIEAVNIGVIGDIV